MSTPIETRDAYDNFLITKGLPPLPAFDPSKQYGGFTEIYGHNASDELLDEAKDLLNTQINLTIPTMHQDVINSVIWYIDPTAFSEEGRQVTRVVWKTSPL